jgi:hypothetical protein
MSFGLLTQPYRNNPGLLTMHILLLVEPAVQRSTAKFRAGWPTLQVAVVEQDRAWLGRSFGFPSIAAIGVNQHHLVQKHSKQVQDETASNRVVRSELLSSNSENADEHCIG